MPTAEQLLAALPGATDIHTTDEALGLMDNIRAALATLVPSAEDVRVSLRHTSARVPYFPNTHGTNSNVRHTSARVSYPSFTDAPTRQAIEEVCRLFVCHEFDETNARYSRYICQNSLPPNTEGVTVEGVPFSTALWQQTLGKVEMLTCNEYTPSPSVLARREKKMLLNEVDHTLNTAQRPSPRKV